MRADDDVMSDAVRLQKVNEVLDRLKALSADHVLLIEGLKDRRALNAVGIRGDMFQIQSSGGPAAAAQYVQEHGGKAVILTDWDRRGGSLASDLRDLLGPDADTDVRADLAALSRHYIKDVESLDSFIERLSASEERRGSVGLLLPPHLQVGDRKPELREPDGGVRVAFGGGIGV